MMTDATSEEATPTTTTGRGGARRLAIHKRSFTAHVVERYYACQILAGPHEPTGSYRL